MKTKFNGILTLLIALSVQFIFAQKTVSGTVSDENGALPGVNVVIKGTQTGTETDFDGKYSIVAKKGDVLQFSYVGMETALVTVGDATNYDVKLEAAAGNILDEIVLVGYGTQKRSEVTSSISKINTKDTQSLVTPSFEGQIAGKASGVQVTTNNGIIGEAPRIRIRGIASITSGTYPLIIVDGMPVYTGDIGGYADTNALADINPNDIESFDILKDGAATAIYGSRAANGVILITTKKGKNGRMEVNYSTNIGVASPIKTFDLLHTADFLVIANEKSTNAGSTAWAVGSDFDTDWQAAVLNKSAVQMDHNLSFNGGNDKTKYFFSVGYTSQEGIALANDMKRYSMRTNIEHKVKDWLTIGGNIAFTKSEFNGLNTGANSLSGNIFNAIKQLPNTPIYDPSTPTGYNITGSTVGQWDNTESVGDNITNIVYVIDHNKYYSKINHTLIGAFASVDLFKGLNYRLQYSIDNPITSGFLYWNPIHGDGSSTNGRVQNNNADLARWNVQNIFNYNKTFADKHSLGFTGVLEYQKQKNQSFYGVGTDLLNEFFNQNLITSSYATQESGGSVTENGLISYVGRINYNFDKRYFIQGSLRRDGLSKLDAETRWHTFPGLSFGWNVANEKFMKGLSENISEFKIRASYSEVGNTDIGNYPYFSLSQPVTYADETGLAFSQLGAGAGLRWETSNKVDFGVDLSLFDQRLRFVFDYFKNDVVDLILDAPVAPSLGVPGNSITKNIGDLYNKGYEFGVDYKVLDKGSFKWDFSSNLTLEKNEVTKLQDGQDMLGGTFATDTNIGPNLIIREGESLNSLYGYKYWGVNMSNGNPVFYKADGTLVQRNIPNGAYYIYDSNNPTDISVVSSLSATEDKVILGNTMPTYFGSFTNRFSYKSFDLNVFFRFSGGNKIFNATRRGLLNQNLNNNSTEILGRWQSVSNPGDGVTPMLYRGQSDRVNLVNDASSRFVEDGDFITLDNVTLGYKLPKSFTEKVKIDMLRIYVQGQGLVTFTKYKGINPEMETAGVDNNGTPRASIISMGLNIKL